MRIIEGSASTLMPGLPSITSATTWPTWLFINVTPARLDEVWSALKGSLMSYSFGRFEAQVGQLGGEPRTGAVQGVLEGQGLLRHLRPDRLQLPRGVQAPRRPRRRPLVERDHVGLAVGLVVDQQVEEVPRAALLARDVGLA